MRWLKTTLGLTAAATLVLLTLAVGLGLAALLWTGTAGSLAGALDLAARHLPAGQTLQFNNVSGTLGGGGHIGWLRWHQGGLSVEAQDTELAWSPRSLLDGTLRLSRLEIQHLRIDDQRPAHPATPPTALMLPLQVVTPLVVRTLDWAGATPLQLTGLAGNYSFDSKEHRIDAGVVQISSGNYHFSGHLQAQSPLALSLEVQGEVLTPVPGRTQTVTVQASASLQGTLAGPDATLALQARLAPHALPGAPGTARVTPEATAVASQALQASVSASLHPWQPQPVARAQARWQALDLAALWPQAPHTQLTGQATVTPQPPGWQAQVQLANTLAGPWDRQRLPLEHLQTVASYTSGQWVIESLKATGAGGQVQAQGQVHTAARPVPSTGASTPTGRISPATALQWEGRATLQGINPAALDSRLAAASLDGQISARLVAQGLAFEARLQPAGRPGSRTGPATRLDSLGLKTLHAEGLWSAPALTLHTLALETGDARLQGSGSFNTTSQQAEGRFSLSGPGTEATLAGQIGSASGQGDVALRVADATLAWRWLARWPGVPATLAQTRVQGTGDFTGHWQGGWQQQGQALQIQAALNLPSLTWQSPDTPTAQAWHLSALRSELSGSLAALRLSAQGQAHTGTQHLNLQTRIEGGRLGEGLWQARLQTAGLQIQDSLQPGTWSVQLTPGLVVDWKSQASTRMLQVSAGQARLSGPVPGSARLDWQPAQLVWQGTGGLQWHSRGQLQDLPLGWLERLGGSQMANLGLRGDLVLGGRWEADAGDTLRLRATLERTSGDLRLLTEDESLNTLQAGVREARLTLSADAEALSASLRWDSERAGQAQASFATRLLHQDGRWSWPAQAALTGNLRAQLPRVGVWSVLAPPGWRLRGTLDANASLGGTRAAPQWSGTLQASDLAVRSVVDGIEFSQGSLRATLNGQRLDIQSFTLRGAGSGTTGGLLSMKGSVLWPAADSTAPGTPASSLMRLRMELDAQAQSLRLSSRADRRLSVSGNLSARLAEARLVVRGTLKADQALFVMPEDTAPSLGDDVVVRTAGQPASATAAIAATSATPTPAGVRVTPDIAVTLDLGPDFQLRGRGLTTRLAGQLLLGQGAAGTRQPRLTGEIRTVRGTYKAYGQQLDIEEGVLRFNGPFDNPALDVLAIRPNLTQRVGVQITGTALLPRVRLYAEPELADAEKLAWLVLGRSAASGGAESAVLQQAALALLGGNGKGLSAGLAQALGLDELSVRGAASNADGSTTGATVMLGKRLSRNFYVAYERSLAGTMGTFSIFYDLSRRFTLRAQTGEQSAVDLIFTLRYD